MPLRFLLLFLLASVPFAPAPLVAQSPSVVAMDTSSIREWTVPWENTRPRDPYVAPDGKVWFVGQTGNYIANLEPASGEFSRFEIEEGTFPHNLIVDDDGQVWYAGNRNGRIGKLDPASGTITTYMMPDSAARDPHTLIFDGRGNIWFTVQGGGFVGRLQMASGDIRLVEIGRGTRPYGIVVDDDGRPWFNEFGTNKIGMVNPATFELKEYVLPDPAARSRRIAVGLDGGIWYVDYARGHLGRLDPGSGSVREWLLPGQNGSRPYAMAMDDAGRFWVVETGAQPNQFVGFDPDTEQFFSRTAVPSGGGTVRHMMFHAPTRSIWFGTDAGTIGRARVP